MSKLIVLAVLMVLAGCQEGQEVTTFAHQGEYAVTWEVKSTTCAAGLVLPDLLYTGQYPDDYPGGVGGMTAASFYYSNFSGKMTAMNGTDFGADSIVLPSFTMVTDGPSEAMEGFELEFGSGVASATVEATRDSGCKTVYRLHGTLN